MKKVLIVDDSAFSRNIIGKIIKSAGYETVGASGGQEAIRKYTNEHPDIVTVDLLMEDMDGIDLVKQLRELDPEAKIIICSTDKQTFRRDEAAAAGAVDFIAKPVQREVLINALQKHIG